jgi:cytochrome bd-type quinol oxidase subunit 1
VDVAVSLIGFTLVYGALGVIMVRLMYKFARQGTEAALKKSVDVEEFPGSGELFPVGAQD